MCYSFSTGYPKVVACLPIISWQFLCFHIYYIYLHRLCSFLPRRNSMESVASSDSYINQNVYEVIPTYITFDKIPQVDAPAQPSPQVFNNYESCSALPHRESVRYAQISPRTKRISSDPLPSLPIELWWARKLLWQYLYARQVYLANNKIYLTGIYI